MPPLDIQFVLSAPGSTALPPAAVEVAFAGRSNVGKSSLINALANRRRLAQVSRTPGRTRLLNFYTVGDGSSVAGSVVDLPGYGYAAVSARTRSQWPAMIESYLIGRQCLAMIFVLVDGEIGPTELDLTMLAWLRSHGRPHTVVATKLDKVQSSRRLDRRRRLGAACGLDAADVAWVSAASGAGIEELRGRVREVFASRRQQPRDR